MAERWPIDLNPAEPFGSLERGDVSLRARRSSSTQVRLRWRPFSRLVDAKWRA
jgi:hypothetical protein